MMALSRIGNTPNSCFLHPVNWGNFVKHATVKSLFPGEYGVNEPRTNGFHFSQIRQYPEAPTLRLPTNVSEIFSNETGRFTPERIRDIYSSSDVKQFSIESKTIKHDSHVGSYDCFGTVSLNGSMQTNVPKPFNSSGKSNYLNMPGGLWARDGKYIAEDLQKSHYKCQLLKHYKKNGPCRNPIVFNSLSRNYSTQSNTAKASEIKSSEIKNSDFKLTTKEKLEILVKDYGKTIIVFHIGISLISLGGFYLAVSSGIDMSEFLGKVFEENEVMTKILSGSSTFAIAYGIHKLFAPVRFMITFAVAPVLVQFLRRKGILKHPEIVKKLKEAKLKNEANNEVKS